MRSRIRTVILATALITALLFIVFPNVVIQPYTSQNPLALQVALFMIRYRTVAEIASCVLAAASLIGRRSRLTIATVGIVFACAAVSRIDIYETMFHPFGKPSFLPVSETKIDGDEHLLAVNLKNDPRAYPIRTLSYHHIVNDVAGGVPIAVTY